jgi:bile salt-stimulated lipase
MNLVTLLSFFLYALTDADEATVNLPNLGIIEGTSSVSLNGHNYYKFEGVPYAHPPLGEYRFKEPEPVKPWSGTREAKTIHVCMQYQQYIFSGDDPITGDEDCLYLNIYTPTLDKNAKLDVIVYIHGGAFMFLYGGFYGPHYIMDRDVVFINLNYRLGPLGFLSTENDVVPGNNGIKDQILALQWIQNNVEYFGGNPDSVTISGMSAGGASVHIHYLSPRSKGLFHRGISQSGTALCPWVLMENPLDKTKRIASKLGCPSGETGEMVDCLRQKPAEEIVSCVKEFLYWLYNPFSPFGVVVDSWSLDPVLPDHPYTLLKKGQVSDLPWIASLTNFEGMYPASDFLQNGYLEDIDTRWNELLPFILDYNYTVDLKLHDQVSQKIRKHYLGTKKVDRSSFVDFVQIISDRMFVVDVQETVKLQSSAITSNVYSYYFSYKGAHAWYEVVAELADDFGASHAEDTSYILQTPSSDATTTEEDRRMVEIFVEIFTSFAKTGKPKTPIDWTPVSKNLEDASVVLKIDSPQGLWMEELVVEDDTFWKSLPIAENEKLVSGKVKDEL